jgi:uncharacterized YigZ family protein
VAVPLRPPPSDPGGDAASDPDRYLSVVDGAPAELRLRGSRFLGQALRADDQAQAQAALLAQRKARFDATHHCWALRLGPPERPLERGDDGGEPSGTAGVPILGALQRAQIYDCCLVVTRWYGGTKLGMGGLARAYAEAAAQALAAAPRRTVWRTAELGVACSYDDLGAVEATLARAGDAVREVSRAFEPHLQLRVTVLRSRAEPLQAALREATGARAALSLSRRGPPEDTSPPRTPRNR